VSNTNATARLVVEGNEVGVFVQATGSEPNTMHPQHIHPGTVCPGLEADKNQDGIVDDVEGEAVIGAPAIALTLGNSQNYPMANANGTYLYIGSFPLSQVRQSLAAAGTVSTMASPSGGPTETPSAGPSGTAGTASGQDPYGLEGHVIEIHGVGSSVTLPSTVAAVTGDPASQLPVACGLIVRSNE